MQIGHLELLSVKHCRLVQCDPDHCVMQRWCWCVQLVQRFY